jgi:hypothetical protein
MVSLATLITNIARTANKNSPTIFTVLSGVTLLGAVTAAVKATPIALEALDEERKFRYEEIHDDRPLEYIDIIKVTWKFYIPTAALAAASLACMAASNSINTRRNAALASVLTLAEKGFSEYQNQVRAHLGDKKEEQVLAAVAQNELNNAPEPSETNVIVTSRGDTLFRDTLSGYYFYGCKEQVLMTVNQFNARLLREMDIPVRDLYVDLELPAARWMDIMCWSTEHGLVEVAFAPGNSPETDQLCWVISHRNLPVPGWGQ